MLFIVAIIHVHIIPDKNAENAGYRPNSIPYCPPSRLSAPEELKQYKELLDKGIITEDEFEKIKRQILGV